VPRRGREPRVSLAERGLVHRRDLNPQTTFHRRCLVRGAGLEPTWMPNRNPRKSLRHGGLPEREGKVGAQLPCCDTGFQRDGGGLVTEVRFSHRRAPKAMLAGCGDEVQQRVLVGHGHHDEVIALDKPRLSEGREVAVERECCVHRLGDLKPWGKVGPHGDVQPGFGALSYLHTCSLHPLRRCVKD
jgi:hypothetical protein